MEEYKIERAIEDAKKASKLNPLSDEYSKYSLLYRSSNEILSDLCKKVSFEDKEVLTVCGSGDQCLSFLGAGAKSVVNFDVNCLAEYYLILKCIAVLTLSPQEFTKFFITGIKRDKYGDNIGFFSEKKYIKLQNKLPLNVRTFWDYLYNECEERLTSEYNSIFRPHFVYGYNLFLDYINPVIYKRLVKSLEENGLPKFIESNVTNINKIVSGKFDIIYLSNVGDYVYGAQKWQMFLINEIGKLLKENGQIMSYKWSSIDMFDYFTNGFDEIKIMNLMATNHVYTYKKK